MTRFSQHDFTVEGLSALILHHANSARTCAGSLALADLDRPEARNVSHAIVDWLILPIAVSIIIGRRVAGIALAALGPATSNALAALGPGADNALSVLRPAAGDALC